MNADTVITPIPATLFGSEHHNISNHFCEQWHSDKSAYMKVDSSGNNKNPEIHLRGRTPPPSAGDWKDWDFDLFYTPSDDGKKCSVDCSEAFYQRSSACASNSGGVYMYSKGSLDVGCGDFGYNINRAKVARREYERGCYTKEDFIWNGPVEFGLVNYFTQYACPDMKKPVKKGDEATFRHLYRPSNSGATYQYNVWWKEGCELENDGPTEALISDPLDTSPKDDLTCVNYMLDNYRKCNNGGVGGTIQVGCLVYEFKADRSERGW
ncbi:uncharacterized protein PG986_010720 [Apiospora aurea]|uniref:Uncharacterized protein n=1 Tax=Apiospora aurea TaxID=335848 RepID=A0ABR1Q324_9PEZI